MRHDIKSLRPFIGAKDYDISRRFYVELGFKECVVSPDMSVYRSGAFSFYLQKYYVKDWIENTMLFLEVDDAERYYQELKALDLPARYPGVKLTPVHVNDWGDECFLHDPSRILWHFGCFKK